jgi:hypothetical protein
MVKTQGPQGWIAVDLDGTLAEYHGWTKWNEFGAPIPAMVERIRGWLAEGKDVRIFTARVGLPHEESKEETCFKTGEKFTSVMMKFAIAEYTEKHVGTRLRAQSHKDLHTIEIWDDRAHAGRRRGRRGECAQGKSVSGGRRDHVRPARS